MHRNGRCLLQPQRVFGGTRKASTATKLKNLEETTRASELSLSQCPTQLAGHSTFGAHRTDGFSRPAEPGFQRPPKEYGKCFSRKKIDKPMAWDRADGPPLSNLQPVPKPPIPNPSFSVIHSKLNAMRGHSPSQLASTTPSKLLDAQARLRGRSKQHAASTKRVYIPTTVSVGNLATILKVRIAPLQRRITALGLTTSPNYDYVLTADYAALIAEEFGQFPVFDEEAAFDLFPPAPHPNPTSLPLRPPVVTIMGHVDHGKTTLLDTLRSSSVAKGEAGGITQHIGAFSVPVKTESGSSNPASITFLDTPGHAAFSAMRARGAGVTDIIVLVVAADDGIMPQTQEVIELYKKYSDTIGLVVAINKVDKPSANVESVEKALLAEGIQLESYGGDIPVVHVSGLTGKGLPDLIETLSAVAEMQDIRAEQTEFAYAEILESQVRRGLGFDATALVLKGSLKTGSHIISGANYAKVRRMTDSTGAVVKVATPGMAVTVSGWKTLPKAGDNVIEGTEHDIKKALANRVRQRDIEASLAGVDIINETRKADRILRTAEVKAAEARPRYAHQPLIVPPVEQKLGAKELRLVIKADVSGSAEAVEGALQGIGNKVAISKIVSTGVGDVSESDVKMAKAAQATIVAFSVSVPKSIQQLASQHEIPVFSSNIIYKLMDDVREGVRSLLPPIIETKVTGEANVLQLFDIQMKDKSQKKVAGCRVINGLVEKSKQARVVRDTRTIHEGNLDAMRHHKKDITEARKGVECGMSFEHFEDLQEGDLIQFYETIEKPGIL